MAKKPKMIKGKDAPLAQRLTLLLEGRKGDPLFPSMPRGEGVKLAAYLGADPQQVSQYKKGDTQPEDIYTLVKIADYFSTGKRKISVDWLLGRLPENCLSMDPRVQSAARYTGLSDKSVMALNRISYGSKYHFPDDEGKRFLEMALETSFDLDLPDDKTTKKDWNEEFIEDLEKWGDLEKLGGKDKIDPLEPPKTNYETVFGLFYEMVFPPISSHSEVMFPSGYKVPADVLLKLTNEKDISEFYDELRSRYKPDQSVPDRQFIIEELKNEDEDPDEETEE